MTRANEEHRLPALNEFRSELIRAAEARNEESRSWSGRSVAIAVSVVTLFAGVATTALVTTDGEDERPASDDGASSGAGGGNLLEVQTFDDLPQMMASSDAVVVGTISEIAEGRVVGAEGVETDAPAGESAIEAAGALQFNDVTLSVDQILFGSDPGDSGFRLEEEADPGYGLASPSEVGNHGIYFLHRKEDGSAAYRLVSSQGRFLEGDDGEVIPSSTQGAWLKDLAALDFSALQATVEQAVPIAEELPAQAPPVK